jgi:hypothetical protein
MAGLFYDSLSSRQNQMVLAKLLRQIHGSGSSWPQRNVRSAFDLVIRWVIAGLIVGSWSRARFMPYYANIVVKSRTGILLVLTPQYLAQNGSKIKDGCTLTRMAEKRLLAVMDHHRVISERKTTRMSTLIKHISRRTYWRVCR